MLMPFMESLFISRIFVCGFLQRAPLADAQHLVVRLVVPTAEHTGNLSPQSTRAPCRAHAKKTPGVASGRFLKFFPTWISGSKARRSTAR